MWILVFLSLFVPGCSSIPRHVIMAPDVFYIGVPQKIHVALFDVTSPHDVEVAVRLPSASQVISSDHALISADSPKLLTVKINPVAVLNRGDQKHEFVHLFAKCRGPQLRFNSNVKVRLSYRNGILLIHTDKPIYTPDENVRLHAIPLGFDLKPSTKKVKIIVKNPRGNAVQRWQDLVAKSGFLHKRIYLGSSPITGTWKVEAYHGYFFTQQVSVKFEVQKYVLPTFSVIIKGPRYILPTDTSFNVSGKATYSYGKKVKGKVAVRLSILGLHPEPLLFMTFRSLFLTSFAFSVQTKHIQNLLRERWFPEGHRLQIQADVTEKATGKRERAVENSVYFVTTPYRIEIVNTARYFKPGFPFLVKARVSYPNKEIAVGVPMRLTVDHGGYRPSILSLGSDRTITNSEGVATTIFDIPRQARRLNIKVGSKAYCDVFMANFNVNQMIYLIVSRGQIVHSAIIKRTFSIISTLSFDVTPSMSPSARLIVYYVSRRTGQIVSDSLVLEIEDKLPNPILMVPSNLEETNLPLTPYNLKILGTLGTNVTLLGVDQRVYSQNNGNILTPEMVFKQIENSYNYGANGGRNVRDVFENARMVVISRDMTINAATRANGNHGRSRRSLFDDLELTSLLEGHFDPIPSVRQYFPKTWIFSDVTISQNARQVECRQIPRDFQGQCGSAVFPVTLPDTITTWVVQAIGVSNSAGFGIAKPLHITTFKPFFIYLSMPYSVQRGEEITILATVFNYRKYDVSVHLYLKSDKSFCSLASPGETARLTSSRIRVKKESSVSYAINILPVDFGKIPIEVTAIGHNVDDRVLKKLLVVDDVRYNVSLAKGSCNFHLNLTVVQGTALHFYSTSPSSRQQKRLARPRRSIVRRRSRNRKRKPKKKIKRINRKRPSIVKKITPSIPNEITLKVCTQYKHPGRSGMTVIKVGCLTGYTPAEETLIKLVNKDNSSISSYRSSDRAVEFFVNEIASAKPFCITFNMTRLFHVSGVQPVPIEVYDYYEASNKCSLHYNLGEKKRSLGRCRGNACSCYQVLCPESYPYFKSISKRPRQVCKKHYVAIKGQVVYADETYRWVTYSIKATQVIKGKRVLKVNSIFEVRKHFNCIYPNLERGQLALFMGKLEHGKYMTLDAKALVKVQSNSRDMREINELKKRIAREKCKG